jgi:hypothetical protein
MARTLLVAAALTLVAVPAMAEEAKKTDEQSEAGIQVSADGTLARGDANSPWRGSSISYDHVSTTVSLKKDAELTWNPYYAQSLTLAPRYWFHDDFYAGVIWAVEQELTDSDWTTKKHEYMSSDLFLDIGWAGWTERTTKIRLSGAVRLTAPLSKVSQTTTMNFAVAPSLRIARNFDVLQGMNVSWNARWTSRSFDSTTAILDASGIQNCTTADCTALANTGYLNAWGDFSTGPSVAFFPIPRLTLTADMRWTQAYLYDNAELLLNGQPVESVQDSVSSRHSTYFGLGASYDVLDEVSLSASVATPSPQLGADGERRSPFFNRFTQVGIGLSLNVDALVSRLTPRS